MNAERQTHIDRLARGLGFRIVQRPRLAGMMYVEMGYIEGPVVNDQRDYLVMLHELGHCALGHTQGRPPHEAQRWYFDNGVLRSEAEAWEWALNKCAEPIEDASRRFMWDSCLGTYYQAAMQAGKRPSRLPNGNRHYVEFVYDVPDAYFARVTSRIQGDLTDWQIRRVPTKDLESASVSESVRER